MADKEDLSLKLLQLQCIIDSKDRELQILRDQASQDPEDIIYQLKQENEALKKQLRSSPSASTTAVNGCTALPHGVQGVKESEAVASLKTSSEEWQQLLHMLAGRGAGTKLKRATGNGVDGQHDDLVQLNVSGTYMEVPLSVLLQFPASKLAAMFTEGCEDAPLMDSQGRYYMPYEAAAFRKIVSALQARHFLGPNCSYATIQMQRHGEKDADAAFWAYFAELINHLGLQEIVQGHAAPGHLATAGNAAAAAAAGHDRTSHRGGRHSSGGGDRKSHGGSSSNNRGPGAAKAAAAEGGAKAAAVAATVDPAAAAAAAAAASAAAATALMEPAAFVEKTSAQSAADAQSAVLQALQPLQVQPGNELVSPSGAARHSKGGGHHNAAAAAAADKGNKSSSSSSNGGSGANAAAAAAAGPPMTNGGVSNAMAAAALKGLIQQKK